MRLETSEQGAVLVRLIRPASTPGQEGIGSMKVVSVTYFGLS